MPFDKIEAYAYEAACWCVPCTVKKYSANPGSDQPADANGIPLDQEDTETSLITPVFHGQEVQEPQSYNSCGQELEGIACLDMEIRPHTRRTGQRKAYNRLVSKSSSQTSHQTPPAESRETGRNLRRSYPPGVPRLP